MGSGLTSDSGRHRTRRRRRRGIIALQRVLAVCRYTRPILMGGCDSRVRLDEYKQKFNRVGAPGRTEEFDFLLLYPSGCCVQRPTRLVVSKFLNDCETESERTRTRDFLNETPGTGLSFVFLARCPIAIKFIFIVINGLSSKVAKISVHLHCVSLTREP